MLSNRTKQKLKLKILNHFTVMTHYYCHRKIILRMNKQGNWEAKISYLGVPEYTDILAKMEFANTDLAFTICCELIDGGLVCKA